METNKRPLMKHFASVLRKRALATTEIKEEISTQMLQYFSRKDLIQIIKQKYDGTIPKQHDLMELENEDLLKIIGDDIYIISYMTQKWSREPRQVNTKNVEEAKLPVKKEEPKAPKIIKAKNDGKQTPKTSK